VNGANTMPLLLGMIVLGLIVFWAMWEFIELCERV
jgi:hypothetical protein